MKTKILLLFFFSILFLNTKAQTSVYHPFPDSNAIWKLDYQSMPSNCPPLGYCYSINCKILKDTLIGSYIYHLTDCPSDGFCIPAYRQDTINRKVYFPAYNQVSISYEDALLFDFNLQVGDSIKQFIQGMHYGQFWFVDKIDSVYNGAVYLKQWWLNGGGALIIEGVGNLMGLFGEYFFLESGYWVNCMLKNGQSFYHDINTNCSLVGIEDMNLVNTELMFPNPLTFSSTLHFSTQLNNAELIICDMLGKEMMRKRFSGNEMKIEKGNMASGVYFVKVNTDEKQFVQKIIVE